MPAGPWRIERLPHAPQLAKLVASAAEPTAPALPPWRCGPFTTDLREADSRRRRPVFHVAGADAVNIFGRDGVNLLAIVIEGDPLAFRLELACPDGLSRVVAVGDLVAGRGNAGASLSRVGPPGTLLSLPCTWRRCYTCLTPDVAPCGAGTSNQGMRGRSQQTGGRSMKRQVTGALLAAGIALAVFTATALPAAAATSGSETVSGIIVSSGVSGTRTVISSVAVAKGVFNGVGRIVEVPSLPTDPPNVARDDLVTPRALCTSSARAEPTSFSLNPHNCMFKVTVPQAGNYGWHRPVAARPAASPARSARGLGPAVPMAAATASGAPRVDVASSGTLSF